MAIAIIRAAAADFDRLIIVGTPLFLRKLLEDGPEQGVNSQRLRTTVVGGENFSESWRTYISGLLGIEDPDNPTTQFVASSMRAGELRLNLFHGVPETIRIIRRAYRDRGLRDALFGEGLTHTPHFLVDFPMRSFTEEVPAPSWPGGALAVSHRAQDFPPAAVPLQDRGSRQAHPVPQARGDPGPPRSRSRPARAAAGLRRSPRSA